MYDHVVVTQGDTTVVETAAHPDETVAIRVTLNGAEIAFLIPPVAEDEG